MLRILALLILLATPVHAGPWLRAKGSGFSSAALRLQMPDTGAESQRYATLFLEYGLSERLTLGLDASRGIHIEEKTIAFLRLPLLASENGLKMALDLGGGQIGTEPVLRPGLSIGSGFALGSRSGWASLDTLVNYRMDSQRYDVKAEITFGVNFNDDAKGILQLRGGRFANSDPFVRFAPSVVLRLRPQTHLQIGVTQDVIYNLHTGVMIGVWQDF